MLDLGRMDFGAANQPARARDLGSISLFLHCCCQSGAEQPSGHERGSLRPRSHGKFRNRKEIDVMTAIVTRVTDELVKPDDVEDHRVLTGLEVVYEGGALHDKTEDFSNRDLERVVVGFHRLNGHLFETYKRTICLDNRSHRTVFRYTGTFEPNNSSWWERLLAVLHIGKPKAIVIR